MTMITPSYLGETIEYSSLHACRSTLEDPNWSSLIAARFMFARAKTVGPSGRRCNSFAKYPPYDMYEIPRRIGSAKARVLSATGPIGTVKTCEQ